VCINASYRRHLKILANTARPSITQHLFYIQWYICQGWQIHHCI